MNIKKFISLFGLIIFVTFLNGCANTKYNKPFKHNTPLIKEDIRKTGKSEIAKTLDMGPKPLEGNAKKLGKRKKISSEAQRNYLIIPDDYGFRPLVHTDNPITKMYSNVVGFLGGDKEAATKDAVQNLPVVNGIECLPKKIMPIARGSKNSRLVGLVDRHNPVSIRTAVQ